jgi:protoporphyrinogen oxidase
VSGLAAEWPTLPVTGDGRPGDHRQRACEGTPGRAQGRGVGCSHGDTRDPANQEHAMTGTVVLGTGMAAWGAFDRLTTEGVKPRVFDKLPYPGGHTASFASDDGFVFDDGPHISFTKNEQVAELLAEAVDGDYVTGKAQVDNYYEGHWVKHPAIAYLHGLPTDLVTRCLVDFVAASTAPEPERPANFRDWLVASYGETFTDNFPARYGRKYHTVDPELMNTNWLGPRLYRPSLEEVVAGALAPPADEKHYIGGFRYPARGGFQSYLERFFERARPELEQEAVAIDPDARTVRFASGRVEHYDHLVSSVPLPDLVHLLPAPEEVREAADRLACSTCVIVNVGVDREDLSPSHWRYIYDEDIASVRLSHPHMFSEATTPPGHGSIQVEVYYSEKYKPMERSVQDHVPVVLDDLRRMGMLREDDRVVHTSARLIPYANVIFDLDSEPAAALVHDYLGTVGVEPCGRYGDWGYYWTDDSYLSGQRAAQRLLDRQTSA